MPQIVLLTALTAASGLFGGGRQCTSGQCGASWGYPVAVPAPAVAPMTYSVSPYSHAYTYPAYAPMAYALPAPAAPPAVYAAPWVAYSPPTYSSQYVPAGYCPSGTCTRR
jgi:hypothetical protein